MTMTDPVRVGGFFAPFDTEAVISQILAIRQVPIQRLEVQRSLADARKAAIEDLASKFSALRTRVTTLTNSFSVSGKAATVTGTGLTATAGPGASIGSFTVDIAKIATGTKATGVAISAGATPTALLSEANLGTAVTAGNFTINGVQIAVDPTVDTLDAVLARINSSGAGVTATLENDANGRPNIVRIISGSAISLGAGGDTSNFLAAMNLVASPGTTTRESTVGIARLNPTETMANAAWAAGPPVAGDQSFTINGVTIAYNAASDSLNDVLNRINNSSAGVRARYDGLTDQVTLDQTQTGSLAITLADDAGGDFLAKTGLLAAAQQTGQNAEYSVNGGPTQYSSTNTVAPLAGISLSLTAPTTAGSPVTVTVAQDATAAVNAVKSFITDFNAVMEALQSVTKADGSEENNQSGLLSGDASIRQLGSRLRGAIIGGASGDSGIFETLAEVGISFGAIGSAVGTTNTLQLDEAKFKSALETNPGAVQSLFSAISFEAELEAGGTSSISAVTGNYTGSKSGTYAITDDGAGNLEIVFTPDDGSAPTTTTKTIVAGQAYTDIIPGLSVEIGAALQAGASTINVTTASQSPLQALKLFLDQQVGPGKALSQRTTAYDNMIKDLKERQDEMQVRIDREMDRMRDQFTKMEMAQARAQSVLAALQQMTAQLNANRQQQK
jgi:flagellar hook-associated protein 2